MLTRNDNVSSVPEVVKCHFMNPFFESPSKSVPKQDDEHCQSQDLNDKQVNPEEFQIKFLILTIKTL